MSHPYGWLSLLPSLVAVVLAIATRRVVLSMLGAILVGAMIMNSGNPIGAVGDTLELHLWKSFSEEDRLRVFSFTILMGAMIGIIHRSGGMKGLVDVVSKWASDRRRSQIATWVLGMLVFFDDYANTVLLGNTLQPLCDRVKISREKLAYLVDSTAAPVSGLAVISTWVAAEIKFVQDGLDSLEVETTVSAFELFIGSLPYRFYALWALVFVFLIGWMRRDFGPMLTAERKALSATGDVSSLEPTTNEDIAGMPTSGWWNAVVPVAATVIAVLWLLVVTGKEGIDSAGIDSTGAWLREVFGNADSYYSLLWGTTAGLMTAAIMSIGQRLLTFEQLGDAVAHGAKLMLPAIAVLWLASCLSAMTGNKPIHGLGDDNPAMYELDYRLYTGEFLASTIEASSSNPERLAAYLPTIIFVLSAGISFATGTSWGTMAIVMPIAIPLIYPALANQPDWTSNPILACTVGSVLAGSIFGDHCSPISDTTVLSSQSCGCEHTAHVWTQMPYALVVGAISILCGTLPVGFGVSIWILLPVGVAAMVGVLLVFGRRADQ